MAELRHHNRVVIVTGAASGIGRGIAREFGEEGATVVVADVQRESIPGDYYGAEDPRPTDELVTEETPGTGHFIETDVSDPDSVEAMVDETVDEFGHLDVLVNNAGIYIAGDSQSISIEDWDRLLGVNLDGVFYGAKYAVPHLKETRGHLINIGSVHASQGGGGPPYASAKGAVANLTRDLAVELGEHEVNVNAIHPGFIETPIQDYLSEEDIEAALEHTLVPRAGVPADIGKAAVWLASEDAEYVQGEGLHVDGGWTAHRF